MSHSNLLFALYTWGTVAASYIFFRYPKYWFWFHYTSGFINISKITIIQLANTREKCETLNTYISTEDFTKNYNFNNKISEHIQPLWAAIQRLSTMTINHVIWRWNVNSASRRILVHGWIYTVHLTATRSYYKSYTEMTIYIIPSVLHMGSLFMWLILSCLFLFVIAVKDMHVLLRIMERNWFWYKKK